MAQESLPYTVSLEHALSGKGAVAPDKFESALDPATRALRWLRKVHDDGSLELLSVPSRTDDIARARAVASKFSENTSEVAVLGIGGAAFGGRVLPALRRAQ